MIELLLYFIGRGKVLHYQVVSAVYAEGLRKRVKVPCALTRTRYGKFNIILN